MASKIVLDLCGGSELWGRPRRSRHDIFPERLHRPAGQREAIKQTERK